LGESGSGKDFLARYLHDHSHRAGGPFFAINCAALAPELAESELFGHEAGAFTGSRGRKKGLLELAEGGTLLLNEIGELSLYLQAKLLTFLDTQTFTRIGGEQSISVNARILAATNRDLHHEVEEGHFRADLYYRLNVFSLHVPALRDRMEDLPILAEGVLEKLAAKLGRQEVPRLDASALEAISRYSWPGNVRELKNILERALILGKPSRITAADLGIVPEPELMPCGIPLISFCVSISDTCSMNDALLHAKRVAIEDALHRAEGNVSAAARLLGISRDALRHHMKHVGMERS
jgi:two-component system, NtrC family, response regulator AtoC